MPKPKTKKPIGSWKKVKIAGNVVSEDGTGIGLEGLIGLEVLDAYDGKILTKKPEKKQQIDSSVDNLKRKYTAVVESDSGGDSDNEKSKRKRKKQKKKKQIKKVVSNEDSGISENVSEDETDDENVGGKFVMLKNGDNKKKRRKQKKLTKEVEVEVEVKEGALTVEELEGWNGLGVPQSILKALAENGFKSPTEIQTLTLPAAIMGRRDILGAAETGSGKTLAFGIPVLNGILHLKQRAENGESSNLRSLQTLPTVEETNDSDRDLTPPPEELDDIPMPETDAETEAESGEEEDEGEYKPLYALVLTPTRELAVQVRDHLIKAAKYTGIKIAAVFGGLAAVKQQRLLKACPEIVVATPGRLWELLQEGNRHLNKMDSLNFLVIDETDRMVEKGHFEELQLLLDRLNADPLKKAQRQNFVFSATLTLVHDLPDYLHNKMGKKKKIVKLTSEQKMKKLIEKLGISQPKIVDITKTTGTAQSLTECRIVCELDQKDFYLYYFLQRHPGRTIVFCNSIDCVKRLAQLFSLLACSPLPLHANMIQKQRLKNLERFTKNPMGLLIATDVAARGLDIPNVKHVIHYQCPRTSENYVHRSGRTARANTEGIAILIMEPGEVSNYVKLCRTLGRTDDLPMFPVSDRHLKAVKDRVLLAREVDILDLKTRRIQSDIGWKEKAAEEMDIIIDDKTDSESDLEDANDEKIEAHKNIKLLKTKRMRLAKMISQQLFPGGYSYKYPTSTGKLEIPTMEQEGDHSAITVMKDAIEEEKQLKKRKNKKKSYDDEF